MKKTIPLVAKLLLSVIFLIGTFGQTFSTVSVVKKQRGYPLNCTFTGDRSQLCYFYLNGGLATADGCCQGGSTCSVILPQTPE